MSDERTFKGQTDVRRHPRFEMPDDVHATVRDASGRAQDVTVKDLSAGGAGLVADGTFDNDAFVELHMEGVAQPIPGRVKRSFVEGFGMEFDLGEPTRQKEMEAELQKFRQAYAKKEY